MSTFRGKLVFTALATKILKDMKGKKKKGDKKGDREGGFAGFKINDSMLQMLGGFTVLRLTSLVGMANIQFTKEELLALNAKLNRIRKPKKLRQPKQ